MTTATQTAPVPDHLAEDWADLLKYIADAGRKRLDALCGVLGIADRMLEEVDSLEQSLQIVDQCVRDSNAQAAEVPAPVRAMTTDALDLLYWTLYDAKTLDEGRQIIGRARREAEAARPRGEA